MNVPAGEIAVCSIGVGIEILICEQNRSHVVLSAEPDRSACKARVAAAFRESDSLVKAQPPLTDRKSVV